MQYSRIVALKGLFIFWSQLASADCQPASKTTTHTEREQAFVTLAYPLMQIASIANDPEKRLLVREATAALPETDPSRRLANALYANSEARTILDLYSLTLDSMGLRTNLSNLERVAIYSYTTEDYRRINTPLRTKSTGDSVCAYRDFLDQALSRLPDFRGQVSRAFDSPNDTFDKIKVGDVIQEKAFLSTTSNPDLTRFNSRFKLVVQSQHGKDIQALSANPLEAEVLFRSGSTFQITQINPAYNPDGSLDGAVIYANEVTRE